VNNCNGSRLPWEEALTQLLLADKKQSGMLKIKYKSMLELEEILLIAISYVRLKTSKPRNVKT